MSVVGRSMRRCGDWAIFGKHGHVYAVPEGFQLMIFKTSERGWNMAEGRLGFGAVTQDGDSDESLILDRLPTDAQAAEIRAGIGIPKRINLSEGQLASLRKRAAANAIRNWRLPATTPIV